MSVDAKDSFTFNGKSKVPHQKSTGPLQKRIDRSHCLATATTRPRQPAATLAHKPTVVLAVLTVHLSLSYPEATPSLCRTGFVAACRLLAALRACLASRQDQDDGVGVFSWSGSEFLEKPKAHPHGLRARSA